MFDTHTHIRNRSKNSLVNLIYPDSTQALCSMGIHPWYIPSAIDWENFELQFKDANYVAIGECGLDKLCNTDFAKQMEVFQKQIEISERINLPLIIHCVKAYNELIEIKDRIRPTQPWIIHGFTKSKIYESLRKKDFYFSFGSSICNEKNVDLRNLASRIPLELLFLETDEDNTRSIEDIYECLFQLRQEDPEEIIKQLEKNIKKVFRKWKIG